jgi:uncharacterized Ntn-hydrolase superfamily protein
MSLGTFDLTIAPGQVESACRRQVVDYTGPSTYVAGGDPVTPDNVRMGKVFAVLGGILTNGTVVLNAAYVASTGKLQIFVASTGVEATGDLSAYTGRLEIVGQ